jgi:hypothetical protein
MTRKFGLSKYGQSDRAKAIRKLDGALSTLIRARDSACVPCGWGDVLWMLATPGGEKCMATRFDYRNVAGQCKKENRFEGKNSSASKGKPCRTIPTPIHSIGISAAARYTASGLSLSKGSITSGRISRSMSILPVR